MRHWQPQAVLETLMPLAFAMRLSFRLSAGPFAWPMIQSVRPCFMTMAPSIRAAAAHRGREFGLVCNFARRQRARPPVFLTATLVSNSVTSRRSAGRLRCAPLKSRPARHVEVSARLCQQFCTDPAGSTTGFPDGHADGQRADEMARHDCVMIWLAIRPKTSRADFRWATRISQPTPNSFFRFCGAPVRTTHFQIDRLLRLPM